MKRYKPFFKQEIRCSSYHPYILHERTFDIEQDVNSIYNFIFKTTINSIKSKKFLEPLDTYYSIIGKTGNMFEYVSSDMLTSEDCKNAHKLNPIYIFGGTFNSDSYYSYNSIANNRKYILISLDRDIIQELIDTKYNYPLIYSRLSNQDVRMVKSLINEKYIKAMISHELSHWLNDTLHNNHISKLLTLSVKNRNRDILKLKNVSVDLTHFEIDAQIHAIKQIKSSFKEKDWNSLTLYNIFTIYPSLFSIYEDVSQYGKTVVHIWLKNLVSRMIRENLLGRSMNINSFKV